MVAPLLLPRHPVFLTSKRNTAWKFIWNLIVMASSYHLSFCLPPLVFEAGLQNGKAANRLLPTTWGLQLAFSLYSHCTASIAGKAVLQTTFQSKILKSFIMWSIPVQRSYATHHFQLMASFSQKLHIQMGDLAFRSFLTFFLLLSAFPPHQFWKSYHRRPYHMKVKKLWTYLKQMW